LRRPPPREEMRAPSSLPHSHPHPPAASGGEEGAISTAQPSASMAVLGVRTVAREREGGFRSRGRGVLSGDVCLPVPEPAHLRKMEAGTPPELVLYRSSNRPLEASAQGDWSSTLGHHQ
jgi:hypothetical protein